MERRYVTGLGVGDAVDSVFALQSKEMRAARTGEAYLTAELADRTGSIGAIMFRPDRESLAVPAGTVVRVRGTVTSYRGVSRVSVETIRPARRYDPAEIVPTGTRDTAELIAQMRELMGTISDPALSAIVREVFGEAGFTDRFKVCPASQSYHHAYIGGLLEHTVSVARLCRGLAGLYPHLDIDLLTAGALLHDVGKTDELEYTTRIGYTDEGRMIGHVLLGERRVHAAVTSLGDAVPHDVAVRLSHVLLSHHGELEWGSPKRPCTLEALVLHHADNLDAKTAGFIAAAASASIVEEPWTDSANLFRRPLWAPRAVEDDRPSVPVEDDQFVRIA